MRKKWIWLGSILLFAILWHWLLWIWWHPSPAKKNTDIENEVPDKIVSTVAFPTLQVLTVQGRVEWDFTMKNTEILPDHAILTQIHGVYYKEGENKPSLWITGDRAELYNNTRDIFFQGNIVIKTDNGEQIEADDVTWLYDEDKLNARGNVRLIRRNIVTLTEMLTADLKQRLIRTGPSQTKIMEE